MSPTAIYRWSDGCPAHVAHQTGGEGVYPGWWRTGWAGRVHTGTHPDTLPGPIFSLIWLQDPTYGQMKAISVYL